jgi:hypothetical protein
VYFLNTLYNCDNTFILRLKKKQYCGPGDDFFLPITPTGLDSALFAPPSYQSQRIPPLQHEYITKQIPIHFNAEDESGTLLSA